VQHAQIARRTTPAVRCLRVAYRIWGRIVEVLGRFVRASPFGRLPANAAGCGKTITGESLARAAAATKYSDALRWLASPTKWRDALRSRPLGFPR